MKLKHEPMIQLIKSEDVLDKWPVELMNFLVANTKLMMPPRAVHFQENIVHNIEHINGPPTKILGKNSST